MGRLTVLEELGLDEGWMTFNLVHGRNNPSSLNNFFQHLDRKVRNTDSLDFLSLFRESNKFPPSGSNARSVCVDCLLTIRTVWCEFFSWLESYGPVDEVDVQVTGL